MKHGAAADFTRVLRTHEGEDLATVPHTPDPTLGPIPEPDRTDAHAASVPVGLVPRFPDLSNETGVVLYTPTMGGLGAHWRLMPNDAQRVGGSFPRGGSRPLPVLRLLRLCPTGGTVPMAEVDLTGVAREGVGDYTFPVDAGQGRYYAELGLTMADGAWLMLARSNELDLVFRTGIDLSRLDAVKPHLPGPSAVLTPPPPAAIDTPADLEPALALYPPGPLTRDFPLAIPPAAVSVGTDLPVPSLGLPEDAFLAGLPGPEFRQGPLEGRPFRRRGSGVPAGPPIQPPAAIPINTEAVRLAPIPPLTYGQPPGDVAGILVEAELRITGQAPPGSLIDLFGHPYRIGPGGRFQLVLRVDDPSLLRRALDLNPPPELTVQRDD